MQIQPTTGAPVPPLRNTSDVIAICGDAYSNIAGINYMDIPFNPGQWTSLNLPQSAFAQLFARWRVVLLIPTLLRGYQYFDFRENFKI